MPRTRRGVNKSPAAQLGKRKTVNSKKNLSQNLIENTGKFVATSKEFIPITCVSGERKGNNVKNKHKDNSLTMIIDDDSLNEDFIPLNCPGMNKNVGRKPRRLKVCDNIVSSSTGVISETIVIDDDDDDDGGSIYNVSKICDNENNIINDSIEIIEENSGTKDCCNKRKCDDSIEICLETFNFTEPANKRAKITPSTSNTIVKDIRNPPGFSSASDYKNNGDDDDDIVIIDSDDKRDGIEVLKEFPQSRKSSLALKRKKRKRWDDRNIIKKASTSNLTSLAFQDIRGTTDQHTGKYKSPLMSVANSNLERNGSYCNVVGNNIYNPNNVEKTGLRPVIIDGSNVAYGHGNNKNFSTRGLQICVNYFLQRGHMVVAFVPRFRRSLVSESDKKILDGLHSMRILSFTPSRLLHGRRVTSYDDRFIVQCAAELGGVVVSTDNYRDLVQENEAWRETIERRLLMFTWVGDILMFPDDPCGRNGPRLEEFLRFPQ